jgi:hypothetical protein
MFRRIVTGHDLLAQYRYAAAWSRELGAGQLLARTFLDETLVRPREGGAAVGVDRESVC